MARRGTRAGEKRKTKRSPGARLNLAFGERAKMKKQLSLANGRAAKARRALASEHANPKAPQALGMGAHGGAVVVAGGGAVAGVVGETFPDIFGIDTRLLAGIGLTFWAGSSKSKAAQIGGCMGAGMLAVVASELSSSLIAGEGLDLSVIGLDNTEEQLAANGQ